MKSEELFLLIRGGLTDAWMSDAEAALAAEHFGDARDHVLSEHERENPLGVPDPEDPEYVTYLAAASSKGSRDQHADVRLTGLWQDLVRRMETLPDGAVLPDGVLVRALRTRRMEASTLPSENGALILVDAALHDLAMLHVSLILSSCVIPYESIGGLPVPEPFLDLGTAVRAARSVHGHIRWTGDLGMAFGVALPQPLDNLEQALIERIELFVLAHEYGHSYLGHLSQRSSGVHPAHFGPVAVDLLAVDHRREVEADRFATELLFTDRQGLPVTADETMLQLLAVRIALFVLDQATQTRYFAILDSHPDGSSRYRSVLQSLFGLYGHPAVSDVEGVVEPYFRRFLAFGSDTFDLDAPLARALADTQRIYFPASETEAAGAIDGYEFWEHVFATPVPITLARWGLNFVESQGLDSEDVWKGASHQSTDGAEPDIIASAEADSGEFASMVAVGEAWFHEVHLPQLPVQSFPAGTTFGDVISTFKPSFESNQVLLCEAIQVLGLYRKYREAEVDGTNVRSISDERVLLSARQWVRKVLDDSSSPLSPPGCPDQSL